ncbi:Mariner Mos1 transposase [Acromyrmex echinatior]|uniref:Mariner Mos1 transposase n=1 Tax=Acromyrmex echinatior TaxID=103372 RepID=F4WY41_ACREC|nr:Mariner Mos1 transposase [Acromyrmex echinatior]
MSVYKPNSRHLREVLIFCLNMKKFAAKVYRMLSNTYGEIAISERTCREWFQRFKNGDFDVEDRHSGGKEKIIEDAELEALLDQDLCQNQEELARSLGVIQQAISKRLKVMGRIQKQGNWVPYELKPRDVERRLFACEQLLERQRRTEGISALHCDWERKMGSLP